MDDLLAWADERPMFTVNEAQRAVGGDRASLREKLFRLSKRGALTRIERGKYTVHTDPMIYATHLVRPSYFSLWTGLRYYDLTTQQPTKLQVMAGVNRGDLDQIEFYYSDAMFGFGKERYDGFEIFVASEERLLIDCLSRAQVPITELPELIERVDVDRVTAYATKLGTNAVQKRLGYLLDHLRGERIETLRVADRNYPVLDLTGPDSGDTDPTWRLRVNTDVE